MNAHYKLSATFLKARSEAYTLYKRFELEPLTDKEEIAALLQWAREQQPQLKRQKRYFAYWEMQTFISRWNVRYYKITNQTMCIPDSRAN